jgi:peptidyl-prolyl cis-trans isomerase C
VQSLKSLSVIAFLASSALAQAPAPAPKPAQPGTPAPVAAPAADPNRIVIVINDTKITARDFETFLNGLPEQYRAAAVQGPMKRQIAEQYAQVLVMAQEARKRGLQNDPAVKAQMEFQDNNLLAGALFKQMQSEAKGDDTALKAAYDAKKGDFEQVHARHILIRYKGSPVPLRTGQKELTEEEALAKATEILKRLNGGEDFAKIAKEESDDVGSGSNGGDLGTFRHGQMVPEFEKVAFAQPVGKLSEPVKTQFGYHIIRVEQHDTKPFNDVKSELGPELAKQEAEALKTKAHVQLDDTYFTVTPQPGTPAVPALAPGAAK